LAEIVVSTTFGRGAHLYVAIAKKHSRPLGSSAKAVASAAAAAIAVTAAAMLTLGTIKSSQCPVAI
jgi:hypothetical protein